MSDPGDLIEDLAPRHFASLDQAALEAGMSRIYGGIHRISRISSRRLNFNGVNSAL